MLLQTLFYCYAVVYVAREAYIFLKAFFTITRESEQENREVMGELGDTMRAIPHLDVQSQISIIRAVGKVISKDVVFILSILWMIAGLFTPQYLQFATLVFLTFFGMPFLRFLSPVKYAKYFFFGVKLLNIIMGNIIFLTYYHRAVGHYPYF